MHFNGFFHCFFFFWSWVLPNHVILLLPGNSKCVPRAKLVKCYIIALAVIFQTESTKPRRAGNEKNELLPDSSPSGMKPRSLVRKRSRRF